MVEPPFIGDIRDIDEILPLREDGLYPSALNNCCSKKCAVNLLKKRLPIVGWLPKYSFDDLKGDLIAGITVALTVIPQGLALALLANLPPQYGLYTAFMGCFMYTLFGSSKDLTIGPTAIMSLMTAEHATTGSATYVILLTFLTGCFQLILGVFNFGFLVTFISGSVVSGFTSAAAITIATTQLAGIFGMKSKSQGFMYDVYNFFSGLVNGNIKYGDMTMGLCSILFLIGSKYIGNIQIHRTVPLQLRKVLRILLQAVTTTKNVLLVILCTSVVAILIAHNIDVLTLTQKVQPGLPPFALPVFSYSYFDNATNQTIHKNFVEIVKDMGSGLIIIPLVGILEAIAVAKSFSKGKRLDATQEMIAIGVCNIMGSFVSSYPTTGSFSRTAINYSSGVRTPAGGIVTGFLVLLALGVVSPYFHYIPKASLSALIFTAVLNMVHLSDILIMWRTNKWDLVPFSVTFIGSLILGIEYGIIVGIGVALGYLLYHEAKPKVVCEIHKTSLGQPYISAKPDRTILFPSTDTLRSQILRYVSDYGDEISVVLVDGTHITTLDFTAAVTIKTLINNFKTGNTRLLFTNLKFSVQECIKGASPEEFLYFPSQDEAESYIDALTVKKKFPLAYRGDGPEIIDYVNDENVLVS